MNVWLGDHRGGRLLAADEARIAVDDRGYLQGLGVYETLKVVNGRPFALSRHLRRLEHGASVVGLAKPDIHAVRSAVEAVVSASDLAPLARLRVTYTAGTVGPTLLVTLRPMDPWPDVTTVTTVEACCNERSPTAGVKSTSYAHYALVREQALQVGSSEAVMANTRGDLCEGTTSNVFVVVNGELLTPSLRSGCLPGVTRELVLEWTEAREVDLPYSVLGTAEEVFLTSSTRDVHPVVRVDDRGLDIGPVTRRVQAAFAAGVAAGIDP